MRNQFNTIFLIALLVLVGYLTYLIFSPILVAVFLAFVFSHLFGSWHKTITKLFGIRASLASVATCLLIFLILFVPLIAIFALVASELNQAFHVFRAGTYTAQIENFFSHPIFQTLGLDNEKISQYIDYSQLSGTLKSVGNFMLVVIKTTYQSASHFIFMTVVMFFSLYYLFKDGAKFENKLLKLSPLKDSQERVLLEKFNSMSKATLKGTLVIGIAQGLLLGLLFWITGISSPAIWGLITVIISIIPMIGAVIIWLPAGLILLITGKIWQAIAVLAVGAIIISTIDNFLRPKLVEGQTSLHPVLVFLSTIGGIAVFGITGFILGPVIVVLFLTLLDIYKSEFKKELLKFNK